tara:strand:+ start:1400 stop:2272 length:873 start_codon:yes stop_codon:yes gene_type:complete
MDDLISIIIPTYNRSKLIERSLKSIEDQTIKNYEIIIVDNYSTDNTSSVIKSYSHLPIKYFVVDNNNNIARSRNFGIKNSKGNLIAFLDSDDYWHAKKLEICYKKIKEGFDFIFHNLKIVKEKETLFGTKYLKGRKIKKPFYKDLILNGNPICNSSVMVKKNLLINVNLINESDKLRATEDYNTWIKILNITDKICFLNLCLGFYQYDLSSVSKKNMSFPTLLATKEFFKLLTKKEIIQVKSRIFYMNAKYNFDNNNFGSCLKKFKISLKYGNFIIKIKSIYYLILLFFK